MLRAIRYPFSLVILTAALASAAHTPAAPASAHQAGASRAGGPCYSCLGAPTNTIWDGQLPLGGYQRFGTPWRTGFRLELLFMSDLNEEDNAESWPVVKALDQFGSWANARPAPQRSSVNPPDPRFLAVPAFDFNRARYSSRYVGFVYRPIFDSTGKCVRRLPGNEVALLHKLHYQFERGLYTHGQTCWTQPGTEGQDPFPIVLVGGYVAQGDQVVTVGDFQQPVGTPAPNQPQAYTSFPFETVRGILAAGSDPKFREMIHDVNAEANLITAFICHADGKKPNSVCNRGAIRQILRHVR